MSLPRPKKRRISKADLQAAQSYLWAIAQDERLLASSQARFTKAQYRYVVANKCPAYAESEPPNRFGTWRTQASRGLPAILQAGGGIDLERKGVAALDDDAEVESS